MANEQLELKGKIATLGIDLSLTGAIVREGFGKLTEMTVEFVTHENTLNMGDIVGQPMSVLSKTSASDERYFAGICSEVECVGRIPRGTGYYDYHYVAVVRPWLWMLTRATNNRIFQEKTAVQIIEEVFGDHGFVDFRKELSNTYTTRNYCVQYRETDFDFVSRLMQEEGIYYFFDNAEGVGEVNKMVLCDGAGAHKATPGLDGLEYRESDSRGLEYGNTLTDWANAESVVTGKVTLNDYDMETPRADLKVVKIDEKGSHSHKSYEHYHFPGHYRKDSARGEHLAEVRLQAETVKFKMCRGASNTRKLATGYKLTVTDDTEGSNQGGTYIVTEAVHYFKPSTSQRVEHNRLNRDREDLKYPEEMEKVDATTIFGAIKEDVPFRSPLETPWPEIAGLHTAVVVGKEGEEIWTDEHARIRIQFPWDRDGENNENSTCWVRVATPWSGKGWGFVAIPRIGQEVVIQFEEGDPDRPICTGMLWNQDTKPAFPYPDNATQLGIRTNSSKDGNADVEYNELMFDDKMGEEMMRVQAQKDHQFLIKNKSVLTIGQDEVDAGDHDEEGSLSEVIRNHVTRTIQEGNHYLTIAQGDEEFKIETGSQTIEIETDKTQTIQQNYSTTIAQGNHETTVSAGDLSTTVSQGNHDTTVSLGNISVSASAGKITLEAAQKIELKVGGSKIEITPASIKLTSVMVEIKASAMAKMKGTMTQVEGSAMTIVKGGLTKIN